MTAVLRCLGTAGILSLVAAALAGCGCTSLIERDTPVSRSLERRLSEFSRTGPDGATRRVDELADFAWDRVYFISGEFTSYREINAAVGETIFDGCEGPLLGQEEYLIFTLRGKVVHGVAVIKTRVDGDKRTYSRGAVLRAVSRDPGSHLLELVDRGRRRDAR